MKRIIAILLSLSLTLGIGVSAMADQQIALPNVQYTEYTMLDTSIWYDSKVPITITLPDKYVAGSLIIIRNIPDIDPFTGKPPVIGIVLSNSSTGFTQWYYTGKRTLHGPAAEDEYIQPVNGELIIPITCDLDELHIDFAYDEESGDLTDGRYVINVDYYDRPDVKKFRVFDRYTKKKIKFN